MDARPDGQEVAIRVAAERFPDAVGVLLGGSVFYGRATETSDLDLLLIYRSIPRAFRRNFVAEGWMVDAMGHDIETLRWFVQHADRTSGVPTHAVLLAQSHILRGADEAVVQEARALGEAALQAGPVPWPRAVLDDKVHRLIGQREDLVGARSRAESLATAVLLWSACVEVWLGGRGRWGGAGRAILVALEADDPAFAKEFVSAFDTLFAGGDIAPVLAVVDHVIGELGYPDVAEFEVIAPERCRIR